MSKLLSVFKSSGELAKIARKDTYILFIFLLITATILILIEPKNLLIVVKGSYSLNKLLLFLIIFSMSLCLYSLRRWKDIYD